MAKENKEKIGESILEGKYFGSHVFLVSLESLLRVCLQCY